MVPHRSPAMPRVAKEPFNLAVQLAFNLGGGCHASTRDFGPPGPKNRPFLGRASADFFGPPGPKKEFTGPK